jgi:FHA domain
MLILRELRLAPADGRAPGVESPKKTVFRERSIALVGEKITFGRCKTCTHQLLAPRTVSRIQATLKLDRDGWWLSDGCEIKPSASGVWMGGVQMHKNIRLAEGLVIEIYRSGDYSAELEIRAESEITALTVTDHGDGEQTVVRRELVDIHCAIAECKEAIADLKCRADLQEAKDEELLGIVTATQEMLIKVVQDLPSNLKAEICAEIHALAAELRPKIEEQAVVNANQDKHLKRHQYLLGKILGGITALFLAGWGGANMSAEGAGSVQGWLKLFLSGGAAASAVGFEPKKED